LRPSNRNGIAVGTLAHCIDLTAGSQRPDFGQGFYATTWIHQAKNWANKRARALAAKRRGVPTAVVLRFDVSRDKQAELEALVFTNEKCGFFPCVKYCRSGFRPHARLNAHQTEYDNVYGPVSRWPQRLIMKDCDQVSFHTVKALSVIAALRIELTGDPYFKFED